MQHQAFDERMKQRAQGEIFAASTRAQEKIRQAMQKGALSAGRKQHSRIRLPQAAAFAAAAALILLAAVWIQPPKDLLDRGAVVSEADAFPTPVPVTVPQGELHAAVENRTLRAQATFSNHTGDIWLIDWDAEPAAAVRSSSEPTELIWLETGITLADNAGWKLLSQWEQTDSRIDWKYTGYRVAADLLHWLEGEWLLPGQEGYEEQQMLIEDAFANGALILAAGDWPEGTSGEMMLVLPDRFQQAQPGTEALAYYTQQGMIEKAVEYSGQVWAE